jgi:hypothetical protein
VDGERKAKSEKRKAKSEKRKAKSEKRKAKSEKRKAGPSAALGMTMGGGGGWQPQDEGLQYEGPQDGRRQYEQRHSGQKLSSGAEAR